MADPGSSSVNLKILSPSTEVEGGVNLPNLSADTTITELRQKIQDAVPSKPATDRMRLIYRGRVMANDSDSLLDIFGPDSLRESRDQSLHLVLRELPPSSSAPSPAPRSSTAPPNPFRPPQGPPQIPLQTNPFRTLPVPQPPPRPNSQPHLPQPHHHHLPHHHHHHQVPGLNPFGQGPVPTIPLPAHLQQHFAQAMAQNVQAQQAQQAHSAAQNGNEEGTPAAGAGVPNLVPNSTRTVRQEGIGPNGERWTVTWNNTNVTIPINPNQQPLLPRPFPHPPGFPLPAQRIPSPVPGRPTFPDQVLARIRETMDYARGEMNNVRILLQPPGGPAATTDALAAVNIPPWRVEQIRQAVRNLVGGLNNIDRGLANLVTDPSMAQNRDFVSLQQSASELRAQAVEFEGLLDRLGSGNADASLPSLNTSSATTPASIQTSNNTQSSDFPTELFILSSPQGPVGFLYDQRRTYTTGPMLPTLPFQTFNRQFENNRQLFAGIGQGIARNAAIYANQHVATPPVQHQNQPPVAADAQPAADDAPNPNANLAQPAPPAEDRMNMAGHLWLIFKLACFIYLGGGGWHRTVLMATIAAIAYLGQVGLFDAQFNLIRQHFEALLPIQAAVRPNANAHPNAQNQPTPAQQLDRNITPGEAARRLLQQREDRRFGWIRESLRSAERAFALFVASLWPGIGERVVLAQEERARADRAAEEAAQAQEERRQEEEKKGTDAEVEVEVEGQGQGDAFEEKNRESSSSKGKEKAGEAAVAVQEDGNEALIPTSTL